MPDGETPEEGGDEEEPASGDGGVADLMEKKFGKPKPGGGSNAGPAGAEIETSKKPESGKVGEKTLEPDADSKNDAESDAGT